MTELYSITTDDEEDDGTVHEVFREVEEDEKEKEQVEEKVAVSSRCLTFSQAPCSRQDVDVDTELTEHERSVILRERVAFSGAVAQPFLSFKRSGWSTSASPNLQ